MDVSLLMKIKKTIQRILSLSPKRLAFIAVLFVGVIYLLMPQNSEKLDVRHKGDVSQQMPETYPNIATYEVETAIEEAENTIENIDYSIVEFLSKINLYVREKTEITDQDRADMRQLVAMLPVFIDTGEIKPIEAVLAHFILISTSEVDKGLFQLLANLTESISSYGDFMEYKDFELAQKIPQRLVDLAIMSEEAQFKSFIAD